MVSRGGHEETVTIHIEIDADLADIERVRERIRSLGRDRRDTDGLTRTSRRLDDVANSGRRVNRQLGDTAKKSNAAAKGVDRLDRRLRGLSNLLRSLLTPFRVFGRFLLGLSKISFIGLALEIGLVGIALGGVKLAMITGRLAIRTWEAALRGLAPVAATVAVAIGTVVAGLRELQEVQIAPYVGGSRDAARLVRSVFRDSALSFFGPEGLTSAIGELARAGVAGPGTAAVLRRLGDFTADAKQLSQLAAVYGQVQSTGAVAAGTVERLAEINPVLMSAFAEALGFRGMPNEQELVLQAEQAGLISAQHFAMVFSGELEATDLWEGQLERLNETLVGRFKGMLQRVGFSLADFGEPFLTPVKQMFDSIEYTMGKTLFRMYPLISRFAEASLIPGVATGFEKIADWIIGLVTHIDKLEGFFDRMRSWGHWWRDFFTDVARTLEPLEEGASAAWDLFGPLLKNVFGSQGLGRLIRNFSEAMQENREVLVGFGVALGEIGRAIVTFFDVGNERFIKLLPTLTTLAEWIGNRVIPFLREMMYRIGDIIATITPFIVETLWPQLEKIGDSLMTIIEQAVPAITQIVTLLTPLVDNLLRLFAAIAGLPGVGGGLAVGAMGFAMFGSRISRMLSNYFLSTRAIEYGLGGFGNIRMGMGGRFALGAISAGLGGYVGSRAGTETQGFVSGALAGGAAGVLGGPWGIIFGALAGGIAGLFGQRSVVNALANAIFRASEKAEEMRAIISGEYQRAMARGEGPAAAREFIDRLEEMRTPDSLMAIAEAQGWKPEDFYEVTGPARGGGWTEGGFARRFDFTPEFKQWMENQNSITQRQIDSMQHDIDTWYRQVDTLGERLGVANDEMEDFYLTVEELADRFGVDLTYATAKLSDFAYQLGLIQASTPESIAEESLSRFYDWAFGEDSYIGKLRQREYTEDALASVKGFVDEILAVGGAGFATADTLQGLWESVTAATQGLYPGLTGADLAVQSMRNILYLGNQYPGLNTQILFEQFVPPEILARGGLTTKDYMYWGEQGLDRAISAQREEIDEYIMLLGDQLTLAREDKEVRDAILEAERSRLEDLMPGRLFDEQIGELITTTQEKIAELEQIGGIEALNRVTSGTSGIFSFINAEAFTLTRRFGDLADILTILRDALYGFLGFPIPGEAPSGAPRKGMGRFGAIYSARATSSQPFWERGASHIGRIGTGISGLAGATLKGAGMAGGNVQKTNSDNTTYNYVTQHITGDNPKGIADEVEERLSPYQYRPQ